MICTECGGQLDLFEELKIQLCLYCIWKRRERKREKGIRL